jgi:Ni/Co efflux regulator RcnB
MKKFFSAKALAAVSMVVAFPMAASANSATLEKAYERLHQPLNTEIDNDAQRDRANEPAYKVNVYTGDSYAMNEARQRIQEQTKHATNVGNGDMPNTGSQTDSEALPHGRDW